MMGAIDAVAVHAHTYDNLMMKVLVRLQHRPRFSLICAALAAALASGCGTDVPPIDSDTGAAQDAAQDTAEPDTGADASDVASPRDTGEDIAQDTAGPDTGTDAADTADTSDAGDQEDASDAVDINDTSDPADAADDAAGTASGETCASAIDVTGGGTWDDQTTVGASNDYDSDASAPNCPSGSTSGPDRVYVVAPATTTEYTVTVVPEDDFDPFIHVRSDCSQQACIVGTVLNGPGVQESVTFELQANETGYIIVDGELFDSGDYTLTVETQ